LRNYFSRQIQEIRNDSVLRTFGLLLAFIQALTAVYWLHQNISQWVATGIEGICWPMFPNCESWHVFNATQINLVLILFLLASLGVLVLFLIPKTLSIAYWSLLTINIIKYAIISMDLRLRLNQHIMAFWVALAFLFLPKKKKSIQILIVLFYFWAGFLKINSEWLSGQALYKPLWFFSGPAVAWACTYVVVLEILLVWGLFLSGTWLAWMTLAQLIVFHIFSFPIVGFFYPLLMFALLAIFPLDWGWPPQKLQSFKISFSSFCSRELLMSYIAALVFSFFQLSSKFIPGDTALTGEGRIFSLHIFDSLTTCEAQARIQVAGRGTYAMNLHIPLSVRLHCEPLVYLSRVRRLCRNPEIQKLDFMLSSHRANEEKYHSIINIEDFCSKNITYSLFLPNPWILKDSFR